MFLSAKEIMGIQIFLFSCLMLYVRFPGGSDSKEYGVQSLSQEDPLEKGRATHSSILVWIIPWTEEPDGLQSMWSESVGHG